jgi:NAD(P)-dependent dehydrogenase (short-subunit alcohol dehydrogenase family)
VLGVDLDLAADHPERRGEVRDPLPHPLLVPAQQREPLGFGARSTASDVLAGVDLSGRLVLVTGGYSGIGLETVRALAAAGARIVVPARRPEVARAALGDLAEVVDVVELDLAAAPRPELDEPVDLAILNAGIMACPETRVGPGWEAQLAVNFLGHFALVQGLHLAPGARVVTVSSTGHQLSPMRWADPHFTGGYDKWLAYAQAKTAVALFAVGLTARGTQAFSVHPGAILTPLQRHLDRAEMVAQGWVDEAGTVVAPHFTTPAQGAATALWAATSPLLAGRGGEFCRDCDVAVLSREVDVDHGGVAPHAIDPAEAERLWDWATDLTSPGR